MDDESIHDTIKRLVDEGHAIWSEGASTDNDGVITSYRLKAFGGYALGRPYLSGMTFDFYADEESLEKALSKGDVESAYGVASDHALTASYSRVFGVFWNGSGALTLGLLGNIRWDWLPPLLLGSLLGGYAGAHLAIAKGNRWIKRAYELITVAVGLSLILY